MEDDVDGVAPRRAWTDAASPAPIWLGIALVVAGFVAITFTWVQVSVLVLVPAQVPLLVSGGLTGIALVLVGLTVVNVQVQRNQTAQRIAELRRLTAIATGSEPSANGAGPAWAPPGVPEAVVDDAPWESPRPVSRSVWE